MKFSPVLDYNMSDDSNPFALTEHVLKVLNGKNLAYLQVSEGLSMEGKDAERSALFFKGDKKSIRELYRKHYNGTWVANFGFDQASGNDAIAKGHADIIAYGKHYVANDDLAGKFASGKPLNSMFAVADQSKIPFYLYGFGPEGYTDVSVFNPLPSQ